MLLKTLLQYIANFFFLSFWKRSNLNTVSKSRRKKKNINWNLFQLIEHKNFLNNFSKNKTRTTWQTNQWQRQRKSCKNERTKKILPTTETLLFQTRHLINYIDSLYRRDHRKSRWLTRFVRPVWRRKKKKRNEPMKANKILLASHKIGREGNNLIGLYGSSAYLLI